MLLKCLLCIIYTVCVTPFLINPKEFGGAHSSQSVVTVPCSLATTGRPVPGIAEHVVTQSYMYLYSIRYKRLQKTLFSEITVVFRRRKHAYISTQIPTDFLRTSYGHLQFWTPRKTGCGELVAFAILLSIRLLISFKTCYEVLIWIYITTGVLITIQRSNLFIRLSHGFHRKYFGQRLSHRVLVSLTTLSEPREVDKVRVTGEVRLRKNASFLTIIYAFEQNDERIFRSFFWTSHSRTQATGFQPEEGCDLLVHSRAYKNFITTSIKVNL